MKTFPYIYIFLYRVCAFYFRSTSEIRMSTACNHHELSDFWKHMHFVKPMAFKCTSEIHMFDACCHQQIWGIVESVYIFSNRRCSYFRSSDRSVGALSVLYHCAQAVTEHRQGLPGQRFLLMLRSKAANPTFEFEPFTFGHTHQEIWGPLESTWKHIHFSKPNAFFIFRVHVRNSHAWNM